MQGFWLSFCTYRVTTLKVWPGKNMHIRTPDFTDLPACSELVTLYTNQAKSILSKAAMAELKVTVRIASVTKQDYSQKFSFLLMHAIH